MCRAHGGFSLSCSFSSKVSNCDFLVLVLGSWHGYFQWSPFWNSWSIQDGKYTSHLFIGFLLLFLTKIKVSSFGFWGKVELQNGYTCDLFPGALLTHVLPNQVEIFSFIVHKQIVGPFKVIYCDCIPHAWYPFAYYYCICEIDTLDVESCEVED